METPRQYLLNYYQKQVSEFQHQFHQTVTLFDEDAIHDLRVCLKRIRAFFRLLEYFNPEFKQKENFRFFRKIFKDIGLIRDLQVQIGLMKDFHRYYDRRFKHYLADLATEAKVHLKHELDLVHLENLETVEEKVENCVQGIDEQIFYPQVSVFIMAKVESTINQFQNGNDPKKMHRSRILLKDAYYILQLLEEGQPLEKYYPELLEKVDLLQGTFGIWHDWEVVLDHYENYLVYRDC